ncbi:MAG: DUF3107 domain-containing protein [Nocardioidaceae bacterium]
MEVRIGVTHTSRELTLDTSMSTDDLHKTLSTALTSDESLLVLTDDKGRTVYVPVEKLAYVEISGQAGRRMGFGVL